MQAQNGIKVWPKVIAHRGASAYAPENTLSAMREAKKLGATWVEFDVQLTLDGQLVVFHDDLLNRTTNGEGLLVNKTYSEIKKLDAGSWFSSSFTGEGIPSLKDLLACLLDEGLSMNLEIKSAPSAESKVVSAVLELLKIDWPESACPPLISSFDYLVLKALSSQNHHYPVGLLLHEWISDWSVFAKELKNVVSIHLNRDIVTAERVSEIKRQGYHVLTYTVNCSADQLILYGLGVDGVFTDDLREVKV